MFPSGVFHEAFWDFTRAWARLLGADVLFKLAAFAVLTPLVGVALRAFLSLAGQSVVADQDILFFILSPIGIVTLTAVTAATIAIAAVEQAALMTVGLGAVEDVRVGVMPALGLAFGDLGRILELAARLVVRVLAVAAPFLAAAGLVYALLLTEHDINFYLSERPPVFWLAASLVAAIAAALAWALVPRLLGWVYALPLQLFERVPPRRALDASSERAAGHRVQILVALAGWALFSLLLSAVALGSVAALGRIVVPSVQGSLGALLFVLGGLLVLWSAANLLVSLLQASILALVVVRLYDGYARAAQVALPVEARERTMRRSTPLVPVVAGLLISAVGAGVLGAYLLRTTRTEDDVLVIAHRGAAGRAPENTLAAFEAAMDDGADLVELDVQEAKDGAVVVIHDSDFMKIAGEPVKVWDATLDELRAFDIGSWFAPEFSTERTPTLEEVLALAKRRGARLDIELKFYGHDERLEERVIELVESANMER